jgi:3-dehydroquinate synthase
MAKITVNLKERSYDVMIGANCLASLGDQLKAHDVVIITDPLVNDLFGDLLRRGLKDFRCHTLEVARGEKNKDLKNASKLIDELVKLSAHRDTLIIAFGGGVIGDLAGFVAATYMRGLDYVQVPTTLLAQVDAAIGGKTAVNHPKCKNLIGCFYQPKLVFCDIQTLTSLPARELRTGLAEVVKYGVIEDEAFFKFLEENSHHLNTKAFEAPDTLRAALKVWQIIVTESAKIKARIVAQDEKEEGLRMVLNYGHTVGHAIETLTRYRAYNHGEAVAIGMVAAAKIATGLRLLKPDGVKRIIGLLENLGLPTAVESLTVRQVVRALGIDKKVKGGKIQFVLPERIGKVCISSDVPVKLVKQVLTELGRR